MAGRPFRRRDALAEGLPASQLDRLVTQGRLRRVHWEVYVDAQAPDTAELRARAVGLVLPQGAALVRASAAWLHGIDARPPGGQLELPEIVCAVPAGRASPLRRPGVHCHQADLGDDVVEVAGVPCTSPLRTAVDLLRFAPPFIGLAAADAMAARGLITAEATATEVERRKGQRFVDRARRLAALIDPGSESAGESWLRLRMADAGFPRPETQIWVPEPRPGAYRIDLGYRSIRRGVEYDGEEFHGSADQRAYDEERRGRLADEHGWLILPVGRGEVLGPSLALEYALGEFLGMEPQLRRRLW
jgi:hypothetical protein